MKKILLMATVLLISAAAFADETAKTADAQAPAANAPKVKYKTGKDVNFEELLIQGQLKRPEITVVTGDSAQGTDGLLRLRENFTDRMAMDFGEDAK